MADRYEEPITVSLTAVLGVVAHTVWWKDLFGHMASLSIRGPGFSKKSLHSSEMTCVNIFTKQFFVAGNDSFFCCFNKTIMRNHLNLIIVLVCLSSAASRLLPSRFLWASTRRSTSLMGRLRNWLTGSEQSWKRLRITSSNKIKDWTFRT